MHCLQLCVTKFSEWEEANDEGREIPPAIEEAQDILQSLVERMAKSDPEDFELDKSSDFAATSSVGQKNRNLARIAMGVYEVCFLETFQSPSFIKAILINNSHYWNTLSPLEISGIRLDSEYL